VRVLLVNECPTGLDGSGGVEMHVPQLQRALAERGIQTGLLAQQLRGHPESYDKDKFLIPDFNAPPLRKRLLRNIRQHHAALKKAAACVHEFKPDVIHIHNLMNPGALHMLRRCGVPVVKSIHDCRPFCVKPPPVVASRLIGDSETFCDISFGMRCWPRCYAHSGKTAIARLEAWSFFPANLRALHEIVQADQLVVYSRYLKELALRKMPDERRVHIIHHFTDVEGVPEDLSAKPAKLPVFIYAGRLSPEKGILHIFDALERIPEIPCRVIIAGDGPIRDEVERRSRNCHPAHKVEVKGFVRQKQLYELYRKSSILLFPSIGSEGCGLSGIETMYFNTPVIGYDSGGVGEWLVNGETGILLPRGDIVGLARAMTELASNPEKTARLGRQARAFVSQQFRKEAHINRLLDIYEQAIKNSECATKS
jgi:glycosyltransferase involved in cell wall biosynthesis